MKRVIEKSNNQKIEEPKKVFIQVKMTARCLFGSPDPGASDQFVSKVYNTKKWAFERKWNFSLDTESSTSSGQPQEKSNNQVNCYEWEGPFHHHDNYMRKCDDSGNKKNNNYQVASSRLPLLAAPVEEEEDPTGLIILPETSPGGSHLTPPGKKIIINNNINEMPRRSRTSSSRNRRSSSSSSSSSLVSPDVVSPDDLVFTFPSLKQRCITDYMKVKKVPRVK